MGGSSATDNPRARELHATSRLIADLNNQEMRYAEYWVALGTSHLPPLRFFIGLQVHRCSAASPQLSSMKSSHLVATGECAFPLIELMSRGLKVKGGQTERRYVMLTPPLCIHCFVITRRSSLGMTPWFVMACSRRSYLSVERSQQQIS